MVFARTFFHVDFQIITKITAIFLFVLKKHLKKWLSLFHNLKTKSSWNLNQNIQDQHWY